MNDRGVHVLDDFKWPLKLGLIFCLVLARLHGAIGITLGGFCTALHTSAIGKCMLDERHCCEAQRNCQDNTCDAKREKFLHDLFRSCKTSRYRAFFQVHLQYLSLTSACQYLYWVYVL